MIFATVKIVDVDQSPFKGTSADEIDVAQGQKIDNLSAIQNRSIFPKFSMAN